MTKKAETILEFVMGTKKSAKVKKTVSKKLTTKSRATSVSPMGRNEDVAIDSIEHYNGVLIEGLRSDFKFVIEHMTGIEERLGKRIDNLEQNMNNRFESVETVLKYHSGLFHKNHEDHARLEMILKHHSDQLHKNEEDHSRLETILKHHSDQLHKNEEDHSRLESKLDVVIEKVEKHDQDIQKINLVVFAS